MNATLTVRLGFEAAHRLPALGGKCANLHGHSWGAEITMTGPIGPEAVVADLGVIKSALRQWIDGNLDHATLLGYADPLVKALQAEDCRLYLFGESDGYVPDLDWPTTEAVAVLLHRMTGAILHIEPYLSDDLAVRSVRVTEAPTISAVYP